MLLPPIESPVLLQFNAISLGPGLLIRPPHTPSPLCVQAQLDSAPSNAISQETSFQKSFLYRL
jgi:hypothetical protein